MWLILYCKESVEVYTLNNLLKNQTLDTTIFNQEWLEMYRNMEDLETNCIKLETDEEINNIINNKKNIKITQFPVLLNIDNNNCINNIFYTKDIFRPDEFDLAITIESMNKPF